MKITMLLIMFPFYLFAQHFRGQEITAWKKQSANIKIIRDKFGIPHIFGKTDADAVFGLLYAQCEDDFKRVELNYIEKLGRLSEINGAKDLYNDLLIRLVIDSSDAIRDYMNAPPWLKSILDAYADGINFFLYKNPQIKPSLLNRFYPWYPLLWTDGSIGAISTGGIMMDEIKNFYADPYLLQDQTSVIFQPKIDDVDVTGSNGFAVAPKITENGHAILYINPHVTFYFRPEVHMMSEEGLNAYGAVTWGQPFVYQGFNEHCGWMHTSSQADISDAYIEKLVITNKKNFYLYDGKLMPVKNKTIGITIKTQQGFTNKVFNCMFTAHGPVLAKRNGNYLSLRHNNRDTKSFVQSWLRTKATSFTGFKKIMDMGANSSNNTVYADTEGNIAYWHGNFLPKRNPQFDWSKPVDGTIAATEWKGYHPVNETVHIYNPTNGWLQNCNSSPFTVAGKNSPQKKDYASYLAPDEENFRGLNAVKILDAEKKFTIDKMIKAGYDPYLTAFEKLVPALVIAIEKNVFTNDSLFASLTEAKETLKNWNFRCDENSIATTLAIEWAERLLPLINKTVDDDGNNISSFVTRTEKFIFNADEPILINPFKNTLLDIEKKFGSWQIPWGQINRFQRISEDIVNHFDDAKISYPVAYASSLWGMLPSYNSRSFDGTKKRYGVNGNSFVCVVEFGKKIKAKSLLAGGQSGHFDSPHYFDQGLMYSKGKFKDVLFYEEDILQHAQKTYHPGQH